MTISLIENHYVYKNKAFKLVEIAALVFWVLIAVYYAYPNGALQSLGLENYINTAIQIFIVISLLLGATHNLLFTRIGSILFHYDTLILEKDGWTKQIDLKQVQSLKIKYDTEKTHILEVDTDTYEIVLDAKEFKALKAHKSLVPIEFPERKRLHSFMDLFR